MRAQSGMRGSSTVAILGSTGSIGTRALEVVERHPDRIRVGGLHVFRRVDRLAEQVRRWKPSLVGIGDPAAVDAFDRSCLPAGCHLVVGEQAAESIAADPSSDVVLNAIVGGAGLLPSLAALNRGARLALANKESMVLAGPLVREAARRSGSRILPIDSEHSGLFQCLEGRDPAEVKRVILTASGGPFRDRPAATLATATPAETLRHPVWPMGARITVDSATLMNKGLEVLEAHHLFDIPLEKIEVVIHRQSIVHALIEMTDGSVIAQLAIPDMILPVQYALSWPERWEPPRPSLDLAALGRLDFEPPDVIRFPCLSLAYRAGRTGGVHPAAMNAADEVAVEAFLGGSILFPDIALVIEEVLAATAAANESPLDAATILAADRAARARARERIAAIARPAPGVL